MGAEGDIVELIARGRSPLFDAALAQLLRAYHSDLEAARLEMQAGAPKDTGAPPTSTAEVVVGESFSEGAESPSGRPKMSAKAWLQLLPDTTSAHSKHADTPVHAEIDAGVAEDIVSSGGSDKFGLEETDLAEIPVAGGSLSTAGAEARRMERRKTIHDRHRQHLKRLVKAAESNHVLQNIVDSACFEAISASLVVLFCLLTALDMQKEGLYLGHELGWPHYRDPRTTGWLQAGAALMILMYVIGAMFALEVIFRLVATRRKFFCDMWSYFDIAILMLWAIEAVATEYFADMRILRSLRLLRLLRFIKLIRYVNQLEALYFLIQAMCSSLRILTWCCLMLLAVQTMTAFLISQLLFAFYFSDAGHPLQERLEVFEYFGSFARSLLTTFEMAMGNWPIPARILFENVSEWFVVFSVVHKMTVGFSILGIINAVFVQETLHLATFDDIAMVIRKRRQAQAMREKLEQLFHAADGNEDGRLSREEFREILEHTDVRLWLASMDFDCKDPDDLFDLLDNDNGGDLSCDEFFGGMTSLRGHARAMDLLSVIEEVHKLRKFLGDNPDLPAKKMLRGGSSCASGTVSWQRPPGR